MTQQKQEKLQQNGAEKKKDKPSANDLTSIMKSCNKERFLVKKKPKKKINHPCFGFALIQALW